MCDEGNESESYKVDAEGTRESATRQNPGDNTEDIRSRVSATEREQAQARKKQDEAEARRRKKSHGKERGGEGTSNQDSLRNDQAESLPRRSSRCTKGKIPDKFTVSTSKTGRRNVKKENPLNKEKATKGKNTAKVHENLRLNYTLTQENVDQTSVMESDKSQSSARENSRRSVTSSAAKSTRDRLLAELHQAEEEDRLQREIERKQLERRKRILELQKQIELSEMGESEEDEIESLSDNTEQSAKSKVHSWMKKSVSSKSSIKHENGVMQSQREGHKNDSDLGKYLARQAMGGDLPTFSGNITDWPVFLSAYTQTTEACGFSFFENAMRLQKCLKGEALEAVRSLLMTGDCERVMGVLKARFGRQEHIIQYLIRKATDSPAMKVVRPESLIKFSNQVTNLTGSIKSLNCPAYLLNPVLTEQLIQKLPAPLRLEWGEVVVDKNGSVSLEDFSVWLEKKAACASAICNPLDSVQAGKEKRVLSINEEQYDNCRYCNKEHAIDKCPEIKKIAIGERWKWAKRSRVCFGCLERRHPIQKCKRGPCGRDGCQRRHHPLLHKEEPRSNDNYQASKNTTFSKNPNEESKSSTTEKSEARFTGAVECSRKFRKRVLLRILPVTVKGPAGEINTYAYLDTGSNVTLIQEDLARKLGLRGPTEPLLTEWMDESTLEDNQSRRVSCKVKGTTSKYFQLTEVRTIKKVKLPRQSITADMKAWDHVKDLNIPDMERAEPKLLIGEDHSHLIRVQKTIVGRPGTAEASLTALGWLLHGKYLDGRVDENYTLLIHRNEEECEMGELLRKFWSTEAFGVTPTMQTLRSKEDQRAIDILDRTAKRVGDHWEVGLLWKRDNDVLPESRKAAEKRHRLVEMRLSKNPTLKEKYNAKYKEYQEKGYAVLLTEEEAAKMNPRTCYLPHFPVIHPQKPEKPRLVFDAAAKSNGTSLNDRLLKGPDLLNSLVGVLLTFRERKIALCGDIKEMFLQVRIRPEDRDSQRFLARDEETGKIRVMRMESMIFGAVSSPYIAQEIKNRNAREFHQEYPAACRAITEKHYMDDYLDSVDTEAEAIQLAKDVALVHRKGGFVICNWLSNSQEVLDALPTETVASRGRQVPISHEEISRVLGMIWNPDADHLMYSLNFPRVRTECFQSQRIPTKREVLKMTMSLFDPLGLLSHLVIRAKILLQDIWRKGITWDEKIPTDLHGRWRTWLEDLQRTSTLKIPRCYSTGIERAKSIQLHVFGDASEKAFSAVAYLRVEGDNCIQVSLVMAKSRVAPLKILTIPRLELQAAVMASRLAKFIRENHSLKIDRQVFWSDSITVLRWIRSEARKFQTFVAHRISEILDITTESEWRWVPTEDNVADEATTDTQTMEIESTSRWFTGPQFLNYTEDAWPLQTHKKLEKEEEATELKREFCLPINNEVISHFFDCFRFSKWSKMVRCLAWVKRAAARWLKKEENTGELTASEIQWAEQYLLKRSQTEAFPQEVRRLKEGLDLEKSSRLLSFSPTVGPDGFVRMRGRIRVSSGISLAEREPIILDGHNHIVQMLIDHYHRKANHLGRERVVNDLREQFWILKIRTAVKGAWNRCQRCIIQRARPSSSGTERSLVNFEPGRNHEENSDRRDRMALQSSRKPYMGGSWERLVGSVKKALEVTLKEQAPKDEVLRTIFAEIEYSVNSRPLTYISDDPSSPECLTPNHFLLPLESVHQVESAPGMFDDNDLILRKEWRKSQRLADQVWKRWIREYRPTINRRTNWFTKQRNLQVGDVVTISDENTPRNHWPKGKIIAIHPGRDGQVRVADVRTAAGTYRRPAAKLCVLVPK